MKLVHILADFSEKHNTIFLIFQTAAGPPRPAHPLFLISSRLASFIFLTDPKCFKSIFFAFFADSGDIVQNGLKDAFSPDLSVKADRKTVNFVLNALKQVKLLAVPLQKHRFKRVADQKVGCSVFIIFRQSRYRDIKAELILKHVARRVNLPFSAVNDD